MATPVLTLQYVPTTGSIHVYLNGVEQYEPTDWTYNSTTKTIAVQPAMEAISTDLLEARYAHTSAAVSVWIDIGFAWIWDAGLYLGATFSAATGYPTTLPTGAYALELIIVKPGESPANYSPPYGFYGIDASGNYTAVVGALPAGAHIWAFWDGPAFDTSVDPFPTLPPDVLVPAILGERGTG
ncbi:MAG: hypothetical protein LH624_00035 [Cryobacterium sp.]|nr:hypothetical protein [Cryobacterium sp.]